MANTPEPARTRLPRLSPIVPVGVMVAILALTLAAAIACPAEAEETARSATVSGTVTFARFARRCPTRRSP